MRGCTAPSSPTRRRERRRVARRASCDETLARPVRPRGAWRVGASRAVQSESRSERVQGAGMAGWGGRARGDPSTRGDATTRHGSASKNHARGDAHPRCRPRGRRALLARRPGRRGPHYRQGVGRQPVVVGAHRCRCPCPAPSRQVGSGPSQTRPERRDQKSQGRRGVRSACRRALHRPRRDGAGRSRRVHAERLGFDRGRPQHQPLEECVRR